MTYLQQAIDNLNELIQPGPERTNDEVLKFFSSMIILQIQKSILSGEQYNEDSTKEIAELNKLIGDLNELIPTEENKGSEWVWKGIDTEELLKAVKILQNGYLPNLTALVKAVKISVENLSNVKDGLIIDTKKFQGYALLQEVTTLLNIKAKDERNANNYYIFLINVLLAYIDDYLECNEETKFTLQNVVTFFENRTTPLAPDIIKKLVHKAEFLKYKIEFRNSRPSKDNEGSSLHPDKPNDDNAFGGFIEKIERHYKGAFSIPDLREQINVFTKETINTLKLEPFHHLNRYYAKLAVTNFESSKEGIDFLLNKLQELADSVGSLPLYDQNAFKSVYKLISNSSLSLQLYSYEKNSYSEIIGSFTEFIKSTTPRTESTFLAVLKKQIDEIFQEHKFPDYYCYIIFVKFLNKLIEEFIRHPDKILTTEILRPESAITETDIRKNIDALSSHIYEVYSQALQDLQVNLKLMMTHKVKPVSLRAIESSVECKWENEDKEEEGILFLDSSYILPINFGYVNQKVQSWFSLLKPQLSHLEDACEIALSRVNISSNISAFEQLVKQNKTQFLAQVDSSTNSLITEAKKNEFRTVQIVAMFVSIATFVLINVKIFDNKTALESFGIILGLAACFVLFNLFFYTTSVLQFKETKEVWSFFRKAWMIVTLPILFIGVSLIILHQEKGKTQNFMKEMNKKLEEDSTLINRMLFKEQKLEEDQAVQKVIQDSIILKRHR